MSVTGEPAGPPLKVGVALLDLIAGLECAVGALAALVGRGSMGSSVSVNLVEAGVTSMINVLGDYLATGVEPRRHGNAHPNIAPYQAFAARDGFLVVAVGNDAQFERLLGVLRLTDAEGRFATNALRVGAREDLAEWLGAAIGSWERAALVDALSAADVPAGPVNSVPEAVASMGDGWLQELDGVRLAPGPLRVEGQLTPLRRPPPRLGEHTDEVVSALE